MKIGPQAIPVETAGPNYGVFTCQVYNENPGATCYDPYQMRHAYNVDALINAGFDGRGKTIVIVDAYQSPNIVQQLNTFNSFYSLPSLNGLGGAPNPSLGTFTQIAPDGLTPFVTGDPNMTPVGRGDLAGRALGARHCSRREYRASSGEIER